MNVTLKPELERLIDEKVARGDYASADALVQQAVQCLIEDDQIEQLQIDDIKHRIQAGDQEIDRGHFVEYDADAIGGLAREVHERGLKIRRSG
jgi:antitoxin ParD1/3/4